jgi:hypothetical protein
MRRSIACVSKRDAHLWFGPGSGLEAGPCPARSKVENVFTNWGTFDARVSASQYQSLEEFPGFHENRTRCRKALLLSTFIQHVYPSIAKDLSVFGISENAKIVKTERGWLDSSGPTL